MSSPEIPCGPPARPLRADAARNRARILTAAREVFAERGLDVTLDDIARHAGLGVGTVYRRFASREALVEVLFDERMQECICRMQAAVRDPDPWTGMINCIRLTCEDLATDRGLRQVMLSSEYGRGQIDTCRLEVMTLGQQLVERARAQGTLKPGFQASDVPMIFLMIGAVADFSDRTTPDLWRRYLDLMIEGMRVPTCGCPADDADDDCDSPPALLEGELKLAMHQFRPSAVRYV